MDDIRPPDMRITTLSPFHKIISSNNRPETDNFVSPLHFCRGEF